MKRTHILNLKSEIDSATRLEVYEETLLRAENSHFLMNEGFCFGLPIVLWGLQHYKDLSPDGNNWSHGHTGIAFPELTTEVLKEMDNYVTKEEGNKLRISFLKQWISKLKFG